MTDTIINLDAERAVDIMRPDASTLDIRYVAATLARINRFNGRTPIPYSVAQHSLHVAQMLPARLRRYGLTHDAHEAITGDITSPMKRALRHLTGIDAVAGLERAWDAAIHARLGLPWPLSGEDAALVHGADMRALATEMRDLLGTPVNRLPYTPAPEIVRPWPWTKAEERFLTEWRRLTEAASFSTAAE